MASNQLPCLAQEWVWPCCFSLSPGAPLPGSSGRGFLSSMAMKYPNSEGLVCSLYLGEILDEGTAIVPHPVFCTQVFIKPPEIERLGRASAPWPLYLGRLNKTLCPENRMRYNCSSLVKNLPQIQ